MKVLALIPESTTEKAQWQYDRVMALIAYDLDVLVVFMNPDKLLKNKAWKCLDLYGVNDVFVFGNDVDAVNKAVFKVKIISLVKLQELINSAVIVI